MKELPLQIKKAIRRYDEVNVDGLTLYPVKVKNFDEFLVARFALEAMQQSFPVALMSVPFLQAVYQMDYEAIVNGKSATGLFSSALLGLALALRLGEGLDAEGRISQFRVMIDQNRPERLKSVNALLNGEEYVTITPIKYAKLRRIIAEQNGVKPVDEDANPDLVKAERDIAELSGTKLDENIDQLISSVCTLTGAEEEEIDEWPIRKLLTRAASMQRALDYLVCGIGGAFGGFGKGGNPVPHPFYERTDKTSVHMALGDFANGAGERAVANAGQKTT